jgi:hypothetical protein
VEMISVTVLAGTADGRVFMAGSQDGHLYELKSLHGLSCPSEQDLPAPGIGVAQVERLLHAPTHEVPVRHGVRYRNLMACVWFCP